MPLKGNSRVSARTSRFIFIAVLVTSLVLLTVIVDVILTSTYFGGIGNGFGSFILTIATIAISALIGYAILALRFPTSRSHEVEKGMQILFVALLLDGLTGLTGLIGFVLSYTVYSILGPIMLSVTPFAATTLLGYAILSRRFPKTPRREVASIVLAVLGVFTYLSAAALNGGNQFVDLLFLVLFLLPFLSALWLAMPTLGGTNYLPAAGISMLAASIFGFLSAAKAIIEVSAGLLVYDLCPAGFSPCYPTAGLIVGVFSALGFAAGITGSVLLLKGRYHDIVLSGVGLLSLSAFVPIIINVVGRGLLSWAIPALCLISLLFIRMTKKGSLTGTGWRSFGLVAGGLGVFAIFLGVFLFSIVFGDDGLSWHPYVDVALPLVLLGAMGILLTHVSVHSASVSPKGALVSIEVGSKNLRASHFEAFIIILGVLLSLTATLTAAAVGPSVFHCGCGFTRIEQLSVSILTFGSVPGQVTFALYNSGTSDVTIVQVLLGQYYPYDGTVTTNTIVTQGGNEVTLTVTFNFTFQVGTRYLFTLVSSQGNKFPVWAIR